MQLQMTAHTQIEPLAVRLLQRSILTQRGPSAAVDLLPCLLPLLLQVLP
jgi:hypothetical protein